MVLGVLGEFAGIGPRPSAALLLMARSSPASTIAPSLAIGTRAAENGLLPAKASMAFDIAEGMAPYEAAARSQFHALQADAGRAAQAQHRVSATSPTAARDPAQPLHPTTAICRPCADCVL